MWMEIGEHVRQRYAKRILGIKNGVEAKIHAETHKYEAIYNILKLFNESILLIKNYAPTRKESRDYYINGELMLIVNSAKNELDTLYYVTLDEDREVNKQKVNQYVKEIRNNNKKVKEINLQQAKQDEITHHIEYTLKRLSKEKVSDSLMGKLQTEREASIQICKECAATAKSLRTENRELMTEMFRKIKMSV